MDDKPTIPIQREAEVWERRREEAQRNLMLKWLPPDLAPPSQASSSSSSPSSSPSSFPPALQTTTTSGWSAWEAPGILSFGCRPEPPVAVELAWLQRRPVQLSSLLDLCVAFIARDFEFCLKAKLILPNCLYMRVLQRTFTAPIE